MRACGDGACDADACGVVFTIVSEASNLDEGLALLARRRPDIAVIDPDSDEVTLDVIPAVKHA
jgi:DNA-binding NarL/FixJ family response regulator